MLHQLKDNRGVDEVQPRQSRLLRYGIATLAAVQALILTLLLEPQLEAESPFVLFFVAVMVSAGYGGLGPGLFTTAFAALSSTYFLVLPAYSLGMSWNEAVWLGVFVLVALLLSLLAATQKYTEETLRQSEEQYRQLVEMSPDTIFVQSEGKYVFVNSAGAKLLGATHPQELIGKSVLDFVHPDDREIVTERMRQVTEEAKSVALLEEKLLRLDGQVVDVEIAATPFSYGGLPAAQAVVHDITERKRAEEALRQSEQHLRLALLTGQLGSWQVDLTTKTLACSNQCKANFGLAPAEDFSYRKLFEVIHPDDRDRVRSAINQAVAERADYEEEYRNIWPDGSIHWVFVRGRTIDEVDGKPERMLGVTLDVTARKQAEVERERLLHREQAARKGAEEANRIKNEFLAVLSHELRSPPNPILGWSKLLQSRKFDQVKIAYALQTIERNAKLQSQLIEDLLDVSRILQGKLSLNVCPVDLATIVEASLETVRLAAEAKSIQLQTIFESKVGQVLGDANRLQQVICNLLSNAITNQSEK